MRTKEFLEQARSRSHRAGDQSGRSEDLRSRFAFTFSAENLKDDPLIAAQKKFRKLGMEKTRERNGVLIFVAPRAQKFAVIGDEGVHREMRRRNSGSELVERMRAHFQQGRISRMRLVEAIEEAGEPCWRSISRKRIRETSSRRT